MDRKQIEEIIDSYRKKSTLELKYGEEKCAYFERVADQIEENIYDYYAPIYESEQDIIDDVKEIFAEVGEYFEESDDE